MRAWPVVAVDRTLWLRDVKLELDEPMYNWRHVHAMVSVQPEKTQPLHDLQPSRSSCDPSRTRAIAPYCPSHMLHCLVWVGSSSRLISNNLSWCLTWRAMSFSRIRINGQGWMERNHIERVSSNGTLQSFRIHGRRPDMGDANGVALAEAMKTNDTLWILQTRMQQPRTTVQSQMV